MVSKLNSIELLIQTNIWMVLKLSNNLNCQLRLFMWHNYILYPIMNMGSSSNAMFLTNQSTAHRNCIHYFAERPISDLASLVNDTFLKVNQKEKFKRQSKKDYQVKLIQQNWGSWESIILSLQWITKLWNLKQAKWYKSGACHPKSH